MPDTTYTFVLHLKDGNEMTFHDDDKDRAIRRANMCLQIHPNIVSIDICRIDTTRQTSLLHTLLAPHDPLDTCGTIEPQEVEPMTTKEQILAIRQSTGLSQARFGKRFGIPTRTIEDWEAGKMSCPAYVAEMLAALAKTDYQTPRNEEEQFPNP